MARLTTTQRGYGTQHQKTRKRLLPLAIGKLCPMCGKPMLRGQFLDLDHSVPLVFGRRSSGDRIVHRRCNREAGMKLGLARRRRRNSRAW